MRFDAREGVDDVRKAPEGISQEMRRLLLVGAAVTRRKLSKISKGIPVFSPEAFVNHGGCCINRLDAYPRFAIRSSKGMHTCAELSSHLIHVQT